MYEIRSLTVKTDCEVKYDLRSVISKYTYNVQNVVQLCFDIYGDIPIELAMFFCIIYTCACTCTHVIPYFFCR